jgi:hypothetical protein
MQWIFFTKHFPIKHTKFLSSETKMPMMYMDDAIAATIQIMQAPVDQIKIHSSYN